MKERYNAVHFIQYQLGDGNNTSLWLDPWHPSGILHDQFPIPLLYDSTCFRDAKVASIIQSGKWQIPEHLAMHLQPIMHNLAQVPIGECQDEPVWTISLKGEYRLKDT
ncbi:Ribonuclease h domain [Thalictrum thalictroides]|uniref:Ribonuclease h domain n=1 Tax=Thalictrum thalictroides TaxID=46969 RepID=A0A7J6WF49_THATH|nr:Ribonuclease h domain [Thalictrum thalictroides]